MWTIWRQSRKKPKGSRHGSDQSETQDSRWNSGTGEAFLRSRAFSWVVLTTPGSLDCLVLGLSSHHRRHVMQLAIHFPTTDPYDSTLEKKRRLRVQRSSLSDSRSLIYFDPPPRQPSAGNDSGPGIRKTENQRIVKDVVCDTTSLHF